MNTPTRAAVLALILIGCSRPTTPAPRHPAGPVVTAPAPQPPAKKAVMVCRNSRTGAKAECGTPDAVMVGMKTE
jgi:hypothetical protein